MNRYYLHKFKIFASQIHFRLLLSILILTILFSCGSKNQETANQIVDNFISGNKIDSRETIFDIQPYFEKGVLVLSGETDDAGLKNRLLSKLKAFKVIDKITLLPDSTIGDKTFGLINLSVANLRSSPNHSAELATQALLGTPVKLLKKDNGWFLVQTPDNYISWIDNDGIMPISKVQLHEWQNSEKVIFAGNNAEVYQSEKAEIPVSDIVMGNILEKLDETKKTINIRFPDGRQGFTNKVNWKDFKPFKNTVQADTLLIQSLALNLTGRPYLWGGTSIHSMDCSGFVKNIYFMNGIILARDASLQTRHGELINVKENFGNLNTGDLLFFGQKGNNDQPEKVTHVALSLGGMEYIHASGKIKRNSFNKESEIYSEYRESTFIRARRIIGSEGKQGIIEIKNHPWY